MCNRPLPSAGSHRLCLPQQAASWSRDGILSSKDHGLFYIEYQFCALSCSCKPASLLHHYCLQMTQICFVVVLIWRHWEQILTEDLQNFQNHLWMLKIWITCIFFSERITCKIRLQTQKDHISYIIENGWYRFPSNIILVQTLYICFKDSPFIQTQIKENIKAPRHWPLCGEFTGTGEFPAQRVSYAENVSIWWRHHVFLIVGNLCSIWINLGFLLLKGIN